MGSLLQVKSQTWFSGEFLYENVLFHSNIFSDGSFSVLLLVDNERLAIIFNTLYVRELYIANMFVNEWSLKILDRFIEESG